MLEVNFYPFPELKTERLILRKINDGDTEQLFKLRADKDVMKHIGKNRMTSINEAEDLLRMVNDSLDSNSGVTWAMVLKDNPKNLIGTIGLWRLIKEHYRAEIGYMLLPDYWRQGLTKEAILKITKFGFNELKLHSIEGRITPLNTASAKILESAGFVREAYFREDFFFEEKFEDTAIYSLLNK
ncbi:MAG TPA: GNAT family N-acetyltransferase [Hanamia sp.]